MVEKPGQVFASGKAHAGRGAAITAISRIKEQIFSVLPLRIKGEANVLFHRRDYLGGI